MDTTNIKQLIQAIHKGEGTAAELIAQSRQAKQELTEALRTDGDLLKELDRHFTNLLQRGDGYLASQREADSKRGA